MCVCCVCVCVCVCVLHVIWLLLTDIFLSNVTKHNFTICINIRNLKIVLIFPVGYHNNFLIGLHNTTECLTLKLLI